MLMIFSLAMGMTVIYQNEKIKTMVTAEQFEQAVAEEGYNTEGRMNQQLIEHYNAGYRAGRMDMVAEIVECDGVNEPEVMSKYLLTGELLNSLGELDHSVYPCEE